MPSFTGAGGAAYSSKRPDWGTPRALFYILDSEFRFELDVCATPENAKCPRFFSPAVDGLKQDWGGVACWMNPPYGRAIGNWVRKAFEEAGKGALVVCLLPARTDTAWWHDYCTRGEVRFLRGRLRFELPGQKPKPAPFPLCIVVFRPRAATAE